MSNNETNDPWHVLLVEDHGDPTGMHWLLQHPQECPDPHPEETATGPITWRYRCFTEHELAEGPRHQVPTVPGRYRVRGQTACTGFPNPVWDSWLEWMPIARLAVGEVP